MGCRILYDAKEDMAALYDSVTDTAFGPVFYQGEDYTDAATRAEKFLEWLPGDARQYMASELTGWLAMWQDRGEPGGDDNDS